MTSQFAQLVRLIAGLGPGDTAARGTWQMDNLLGEDLHRLPALYADGGKSGSPVWARQTPAPAAKWAM